MKLSFRPVSPCGTVGRRLVLADRTRREARFRLGREPERAACVVKKICVTDKRAMRRRAVNGREQRSAASMSKSTAPWRVRSATMEDVRADAAPTGLAGAFGVSR